MASKQIPTAAVELIPNNASRKSLSIQNQDATDSIYLKKEENGQLSVSSTDHDWKLGPNSSLFLSTGVDGIQTIRGRFTAVSSANTPRIAYFETEDVRRS